MNSIFGEMDKSISNHKNILSGSKTNSVIEGPNNKKHIKTQSLIDNSAKLNLSRNKVNTINFKKDEKEAKNYLTEQINKEVQMNLP